MVRQYIGARYVPRFMGEYNASQVYEALDVVDNGLGTSYISKKPTPAGVPLTNTNYWALYGATSGAILDLENRMTAAENDIIEVNERITTRRLIIIGDSYGLETDNHDETYVDKVEERLNLGADNFYSKCVGGAAFGSSTDSLKFVSLIESIEDAVTDPDTITDIIVQCGANDSSISTANTLAGITSFMSYAHSQYKNAKISVFPCGVVFTNTGFDNIMNNIDTTIMLDQSEGYAVIPNSQYVLYDTSFLKSDMVHPNQYGVRKIASALVQAFYNGCLDIKYNRHYNYSSLIITTTDPGTTTYALYSTAYNGISMRRVNGVNKTSPRNKGGNGLTVISSAAMNIPANGTITITIPDVLGTSITEDTNSGFAYSNQGTIYPVLLEYDVDISHKQLVITIPTGIPTADNVTTLHIYFDMITP